jgi:hypothetical protein
MYTKEKEIHSYSEPTIRFSMTSKLHFVWHMLQ